LRAGESPRKSQAVAGFALALALNRHGALLPSRAAWVGSRASAAEGGTSESQAPAGLLPDLSFRCSLFCTRTVPFQPK
jgi:hypothetical protein